MQKANIESWKEWLSYHDKLSQKEKKIMITYLLSPQLSKSSDRENEWKAEHKDYRKRKGQNRKIR